MMEVGGSLFRVLKTRRVNEHTLFISASALTGAFAMVSHHQGHNAECSSESVRGRHNRFPFHDVQIRSVSNSLHQSRYLRHDTQYGMHNANNPMPVILATSPVVSNATDKQMTSRWWRFRLWSPQCTTLDESSKPSWLQRIGKTFFVVARGVEIVMRLSPLVVLTPTAVLVSSADSYIRRIVNRKKNIILSTSGELIRVDDNDMFVKQFEVAGLPKTYEGDNWASNLAWRYTLYTLQTLGPAFCKLGQWAATRRDLFPVHMCNRLSKLHDMANTHSLEYTQNVLTKAFGNYQAKGLAVHHTILGSGSAAQVHKGTLTLPAQKTKTVAIKVLHPNTRQLVERDLALMKHVADFIDTCIPLEMIKMLSLPRAVANFSDIMWRQVDLRIEGDNLHKFRSNFHCSDSIDTPSSVDFPMPEEGFVSERVLVEEHIDAKPISTYLADDSPMGLELRRRLAGPLLRAFLKMVFVDNFVHADLHPGNVLVREPDERDKYTVVFLDAGIAMSLDPRDKQNLTDLFKAVVLNDGYKAGVLMVERARYEHCTSIPGGKHAFASGVADIVAEFHDRSKQGLTLGAVRVGSLLGRVLDLCRRYGVEIDPAMASVVVSMLVLEGLGRSLDPDLNLMKAAMPFLLGRGKV